MIEIERKFRLGDSKRAAVESKLERQYNLSVPVNQVDEVFLLGIDSFAKYKIGIPIARLRTEGDVIKLANKRQLNEKGDALEHELVIQSADAMRAILLDVGYRSIVYVDKVRRESKVGRATLDIEPRKYDQLIAVSREAKD